MLLGDIPNDRVPSAQLQNVGHRLSRPAFPDTEQRPALVFLLSSSPFSRLQVLEVTAAAAAAVDLVSLCA